MQAGGKEPVVTAYQPTLPQTPRRLRQTGADEARTQRLRAHSKRAWDLYNGLMANGESRPLLRPTAGGAHLFNARAFQSHRFPARRCTARQPAV